jgi:hydrophobic/amphiphilic exporter-1 (mainly G- bacteria), HAE1 family
MVMTLAPWHERERSQQEIMADISQRLQRTRRARLRLPAQQPRHSRRRQRPAIRAGRQQLRRARPAALPSSRKWRRSALHSQPRLSTDATQPQLSIEIDRERASDLGIDITGMAEALQAMLDGREIGEVFIDDRSYDVKLVSTTNPINDPTDLENIFLQAPRRALRAGLHHRHHDRAGRAARPRRASSSSVRSPSPGLATISRSATRSPRRAHRRAASAGRQPHRPAGRGGDAGRDGECHVHHHGFSLVIILLVLAAQFESFVSAVIIMATVPLGLACAVFALLITGTSLNVYSQIGLVLLVGIMAKNGILIVEFANQLRDRGQGVREAIEEAANIRLRPGDHDHDVHHRRRRSAGAGIGRRRGGAHRARLGDRGRARAGDGLDAVPDAGRLSAARPLHHPEGGGSRQARPRTGRSRGGRRGLQPAE